MGFLASLERAYRRLPDSPPFGYSPQKIGFVISLNADGTVAHVIDWREGEGKKARPRSVIVPQPVKKTSGVAANFLWDKTSYVLGLTAGEGKRTASEHQCFLEKNLEAIEGSSDAGLRALSLFLKSWKPGQSQLPEWSDDYLDLNVVFTLEENRLDREFIHDRPEARAIWSKLNATDDAKSQFCLVTGEMAPVARLHPSIKWSNPKAQSSGSAIVSFNQESFTSYGHEQGDNAPISEATAFAYTTVLNRYLERDSQHSIPIGNSTAVFWADGSTFAASLAERYAGQIFGLDTSREDERAVKEVALKLDQIVKGMELREIEPELADGIDFYVLGLSPNAARISIRFYWQGSFGQLTENYRHYMNDMAFEPSPEGKPKPSMRQLATRLAPARIDRNNKVSFDSDQIPDRFSGEFLRSVITGDRFPGFLLGHLLMRISSDHLLDHARISMIKAILFRNQRLKAKAENRPVGDNLMVSDPEDPCPARKLGRLFAVLERIQSASLGEEVNATIKDKYLSAAAVTPRQVFSSLLLLIEHHLSRLRRGHSDAKWVEQAANKAGIPVGDMARRVAEGLGSRMGRLAAEFSDTGFPAQHNLEEQGFFMIGYYQERYARKQSGGSADQPENSMDNEPDFDGEK